MNRFANSTRGRRQHPLLRAAALPVAVCLLLLLFFGSGIASISATAQTEQLKSTRQAIVRAAAHCYASEGAYPPSLGILEERYGLQLDREKYIIDYRCFASNIMPEIVVLPRNAAAAGEAQK